jgi:hypothetical protein
VLTVLEAKLMLYFIASKFRIEENSKTLFELTSTMVNSGYNKNIFSSENRQT